MNNLTDITFSLDYAAAFGYTEEELETNFSEYIDAYMSEDDREYEKREDFMTAVRDYYDGYRFSPDSQSKVYNPVSIGFFFKEGCRFRSYWINTGASTLVINLAKTYKLSRLITDDVNLGINSINTFDYSLMAEEKLLDSQVLALLFFTGYLTIKDGNYDFLTLTFPNTEVRKSFTQNLFESFSGIDLSVFAFRGVQAVRAGDIEEIVKVLNAYIKEMQYDGLDKAEKGYQEIFIGFFLMIGGVRASVEDSSLLGRSDVVVERRRDVYIIEMKVDLTADEAVTQIKKNGYYFRYINTDKTIHIIGMNFISAEKQVDGWKEEIVDKTKEPSYLG